MNVIVKVSFDNFDNWKSAFDAHDARADVCDESRTTVGKISDTSCIVMMYDVDMEGMQKLMTSDYLQELTKEHNIVNDEMHTFSPLAPGP